MKFGLSPFLAFLAAATTSSIAFAECASPGSLTCVFTDTAPKLDADLAEWVDVAGIETEMHNIDATITYADGNPSYQCMYDADKIYFALRVPGKYRFDSENDHLCAAIGLMFKVGTKATYIDMGGCPDVLTPGSCEEGGAPATCDDYLVDIGAHWWLKTTEQKVEYGINEGTGNDEVANKDDEYGVSSYCRFDDDDDKAANEWAGAWAHTSATAEEGAAGDYIFELSRSLSTMSSRSDAQLKAGETYEFGIAYWDPFEDEATGWTKPGHYLTGCAKEWIDLSLKAKDDGGMSMNGGGESMNEGGAESTNGGGESGSPTSMTSLLLVMVLAVVAEQILFL